MTSVFGCNSEYYYEILPKLSATIPKFDLYHSFFEDTNRNKTAAITAKYISKRVLINEAAKNDLMAIYRDYSVDQMLESRIMIIHNGIELEGSTLVLRNNKNLKIGFVGRWSDEKRPGLFLQIAKTVQLHQPNTSFLMAGPGIKANLEKLNEANVAYLGDISDKDELNALYQSLDLIVVPSIYEGFPMVIMEAMSYGVIPIATNLPGIQEHIASGRNGILIESNQDENKIAASFSETILKLIENDAMRAEISKDAYEYAHTHFSISRFDNDYKTLLGR